MKTTLLNRQLSLRECWRNKRKLRKVGSRKDSTATDQLPDASAGNDHFQVLCIQNNQLSMYHSPGFLHIFHCQPSVFEQFYRHLYQPVIIMMHISNSHSLQPLRIHSQLYFTSYMMCIAVLQPVTWINLKKCVWLHLLFNALSSFVSCFWMQIQTSKRTTKFATKFFYYMVHYMAFFLTSL